jgi:hypothetical protein
MITAVLIYFAFKVERLENVWIWIKKRSARLWTKMTTRRKNVKGIVIGGVVGGATGGVTEDITGGAAFLV